MIDAYLFLDRNIRLVNPIRIQEPVEYLRVKADHPFEDERVIVESDIDCNTVYHESSTNSTTFFTPLIRNRMPHLIFRLWRKIDNMTCMYLLEGLSDFKKISYVGSMPSMIDIGFQEPDENVSMSKIKKRLRSKKKMKDLLLRYYRS